jgi:hypothetical protein
MGAGIAPIGHKVSVYAASLIIVDISATFTLANGCSFNDVKPDLEQILADYLLEIAKEWGSPLIQKTVIRAAQVESRMINEKQGRVIDIDNIRICNSPPGKNISFLNQFIPVKGAVTHVEQ